MEYFYIFVKLTYFDVLIRPSFQLHQLSDYDANSLYVGKAYTPPTCCWKQPGSAAPVISAYLAILLWWWYPNFCGLFCHSCSFKYPPTAPRSIPSMDFAGAMALVVGPAWLAANYLFNLSLDYTSVVPRQDLTSWGVESWQRSHEESHTHSRT